MIFLERSTAAEESDDENKHAHEDEQVGGRDVVVIVSVLYHWLVLLRGRSSDQAHRDH